MTGMTDLERLVAIEDIKMLMARRVLALNTKDWDTYRACHAPDHVSIGTVGPGEMRGDALHEALKARMVGVVTIHQVHSPAIEFSSPAEARGIWALEDLLFWKEGEVDHWAHGWGHYRDTYAKRGGQWLFTSRRVTRLRIERSPGAIRTYS